MLKRSRFVLPIAALTFSCGASQDAAVSEVSEPYASAQATLLDFDFDAELVTDAHSSDWNSQIQEQLLYTIGHLNGDRAVGRLDNLVLTNVQSSDDGGGRTRVRYHAKLPVSWGSKTTLPTTYELRLPMDVSDSGLRSFSTKYETDCIDFEALGSHEVDPGSMWYYYRPSRAGCVIDPADVVRFTATAVRSTLNTKSVYPEYGKVWEDGTLNVVAVFGKFQEGSTLSTDDGIAAYNAFLKAIGAELAKANLVTTPSSFPDAPGASAPDVEFSATLFGGRRVKVNALLVDDVSNAPDAFYARYEALSTRADLIAYNGHAGLGQNVRALARKGSFVPGQYLIVFMNGCDTFAYVDGSLAYLRAKLNLDDPAGTKYMDSVTNSMPSFFSSMPGASMALIRGLMQYDEPLTYEQIFAGIDPSQVVLVTGEEDNAYRPSSLKNRSALEIEISGAARLVLP